MKNTEQKSTLYVLLLIGFAVIFFIPFIGNAHLFDWDEINFAEIAREMCITKNYSQPQINYQLFTEKPPLFFWLQAISMNIFGINEFAARFPNALLGVVVLPVIFLMGKKLKDSLFGFIWAIVYATTILPHLYFKSGIIDPWFNFFIMMSLWGVFKSIDQKESTSGKYLWPLFAGIMAGLSILTKGPAAILVLGLTGSIFWISQKFRNFLTVSQFVIIGIVTIFTAGLWLGIDYMQNGSVFIKEFTIRQWELFSSKDAGHGGFLLYHVVVLFFGCFPMSAFFIHALRNKEEESDSFSIFRKWMVVLFWVVLVLFSIVQTKIVHYSSLCYFPMSFLAAVGVYYLILNKQQLTKWTKGFIISSALPFIIAPTLVVYLSKNMSMLKSLLSKDPFAVENLQAVVYWTGWELLPGVLLFVFLIISFYFFKRVKNKTAIIALFAGSVIFILTCLYFLINRIEAISQRANIEFWQQHAREDCYKTTFGYKSYTTYFYGEVMPQKNKNYANEDWLLKGVIDKPVYISCKINSKQSFEKEISDAKFLYNKNGFYFYKREPISNTQGN